MRRNKQDEYSECENCGYIHEVEEYIPIMLDYLKEGRRFTPYYYCFECETQFCINCKKECPICYKILCPSCNRTNQCSVCHREVCRSCAIFCNHCDKLICIQCNNNCIICHQNFCDSCSTSCEICHKPVCQDHLLVCQECGQKICPNCSKRCDPCQLTFCDPCGTAHFQQALASTKGRHLDIKAEMEKIQMEKIFERIESKIVGTYYTGNQDLLENLSPDTPLTLKPEPKNLYDSNAISVWLKDEKLGYIPRTQNKSLLQIIKSTDYRAFFKKIYYFQSAIRGQILVLVLQAQQLERVVQAMQELETLGYSNVWDAWKQLSQEELQLIKNYFLTKRGSAVANIIEKLDKFIGKALPFHIELTKQDWEQIFINKSYSEFEAEVGEFFDDIFEDDFEDFDDYF
ncbi:MAG: HIRAN domain-containing protein [Candidatus Helarchaeota archaeon]